MSLVYGNSKYPNENGKFFTLDCRFMYLSCEFVGYHGNNEVYSWGYHSCECCPYGYHIDLDFVRYCESLDQAAAARTDTMDRRRERRRQRQSMEVMLGLIAPIQAAWQNSQNQQLPQVNNQLITKNKKNIRECVILDSPRTSFAAKS